MIWKKPNKLFSKLGSIYNDNVSDLPEGLFREKDNKNGVLEGLGENGKKNMTDSKAERLQRRLILKSCQLFRSYLVISFSMFISHLEQREFLLFVTMKPSWGAFQHFPWINGFSLEQ